MNPTALLKIIAALAPIMGDKEIGASMVAEINAMFAAMQTAAQAQQATAEALREIASRLASIDQKLLGLKLPLSDNDISLLQLANGGLLEAPKDG